MAKTYTNQACPLYDTRYCELLNMADCNTCTVADMSDWAYVKESINVTSSLLPREGISGLFTSEDCVLCTQEPKGKRDGYAIVDIGNPEPKHQKQGALGFKVTADAGSMVPIQAACCKSCKHNLLMVEYLPVLVGALLAAVGLALVTLRPIHDFLASLGAMVPFLAFVVFAVGGIALCRMLRKSLGKKYGASTRLNVFDIPLLRELPEYGWFEIRDGYEKKGVSHCLFTSKPLDKGLFTGIVTKEK